MPAALCCAALLPRAARRKFGPPCTRQLGKTAITSPFPWSRDPDLFQLFHGRNCSHFFAMEFTRIWMSSSQSVSVGTRSTGVDSERARTVAEQCPEWQSRDFGRSGDREFSEHSKALHSRVRGCHVLKYPNGPQALDPQVLCDLCHVPCTRGLLQLVSPESGCPHHCKAPTGVTRSKLQIL